MCSIYVFIPLAGPCGVGALFLFVLFVWRSLRAKNENVFWEHLDFFFFFFYKNIFFLENFLGPIPTLLKNYGIPLYTAPVSNQTHSTWDCFFEQPAHAEKKTEFWKQSLNEKNNSVFCFFSQQFFLLETGYWVSETDTAPYTYNICRGGSGAKRDHFFATTYSSIEWFRLIEKKGQISIWKCRGTYIYGILYCILWLIFFFNREYFVNEERILLL